MTPRTPREIIAGLADTYHCGDCRSDPPELREIAPEIFVLQIGHADGCPVLVGAVSDRADLLRAIDRAS
ncbi:hypothetical protein ACFYPC_04665 [Streptomyces sp. NPDC005808]|uniref:hypothetical protein n=1 Tax=Streptomyces sp. NPDC005808 TaxID=3364734 RepID=UPI0036A022BD